MRIALSSDELYPVQETVMKWLENHGHQIELFGAFKTKADVSWVHAAAQAASAVARGDCDEGIFFCWTGTGISIAANKFPGIRAALCTDAQTAKGARIWNHANVLALSNRLLSQDLAKEILEAWFEDFDDGIGKEGVQLLAQIKTM